jgi:predicted ATP-dependent endonuclease of OLD family
MFIHFIKLSNLLSFGSESEVIEFRPLNLIIGPNSSGKSNLTESIELLRNIDCIFAVVDYADGPQCLIYALSFTSVGQHSEIVDERIENEKRFWGMIIRTLIIISITEFHFLISKEMNRHCVDKALILVNQYFHNDVIRNTIPK